MKSFMNFRVFVIIALSLFVATAFATYVFVSDNIRLTIFFILLALFVLLLIFAIIFKFKMIYLIATVMIFMAMPFINIYFRSEKLNDNLDYSDSEVTVYGKLSENFSYTTSGNLKLTLDDVYLISNGNLAKVDGKIQLYTNPTNFNLEDFTLGRYISVETDSLTFYFLNGNSDSMFYLNRDIVASGYVIFYNVNFTDNYNITLKDRIRNSALEMLSGLDVDYAEVGYAMIFGDTSFIDSDVIDVFQTTGIAHILAVSGLHVSLIVSIFSFILKKLKVPNIVNFIIFAVLLTFYSYLCGFSVSVIRAEIMALFALYASIRGKAYDNLSVLALTASIILVANPLQMFNISFVLSFSAVLAIMLLSSPIKRFVSKFVKPKMASSLSLNLAVQVGLLIISAYYFERYQILGIICNLISVPLSMFAFVILLVGMALSAVFPFMSFVCDIYGYLMGLIVKFNYYISSLNFSFNFLEFNVLNILIAFILMFILSDYVFTKRNKKIMASLMTITASFLCYLVI